MNNRKKLMNIFYILSFFLLFSSILFIPFSSAITWTQSNGSLINNYYNVTNEFDQDLNTTNDVIFNTVHANNLCYSNGTNCIVINNSYAVINQTNNFTATQNINGSLVVQNATGTYLLNVNVTSNNISIISDNGRQFTIMDNAGHIYFRTGSSANTFGYAGATTVNAGNSLLTLAGYTGTDFRTTNIVRMSLNTDTLLFKNSTGTVKSFVNTSTGQFILNTTGTSAEPMLKSNGGIKSGWYDNGYGWTFAIAGSDVFTLSGDSGFVANAGVGTFRVSDGTRVATIRPDTGNFMALRNARYSTTTRSGLVLYSYALDENPPSTNYSRIKFNATNNEPFKISSEANGSGNRTSLLLNFTDVNVTSNLTLYNLTASNVIGNRLNINNTNNYFGRWADSVDDYIVSPNNFRLGGASFNVLSVDKDNKGVTIGGYSPDSSTYQFQVNNFAGQGSTNAVYKFNDGVNPINLARFTLDYDILRFGTATNNSFRLATNWVDALTIDTNQNVGIGTTSPTEKLDVTGTINSYLYKVNGTAGLTTNKQMLNASNITCWMNYTSGLLTASDC